MSRTYASQPDNVVYTKRELVAGFWYALGENAQHLASDRGRTVAAERYLDVALASVSGVEVARFVFDATPLEIAYRVKLSLAAAAGPNARISITWRVITQDIAGATISASAYQTDRILNQQADRPVRLRGTIPLSWPFGDRQALREYHTQWLTHVPDAGCATLGRVLIVHAYLTDGAQLGCWLRGVTAKGYRGGY